MSVAVRLATDADESTWEAFVNTAPAATFFHRYPWRRVLERAFGHRCHFLLAEDGGETVGVLPLAEVRSRLFGHKLSGLPFCVYGGIVASDAAAASALRERACELARELRVEALELRNLVPSDSGWPVKNLYFTFRKILESDNDANLRAIPNRQRAMLRKGLKEGLYAEEDSGTERIYRVYSESVRNLGTPVFSRRYLDVLREEFGSDCRVLMILQTRDGNPVGGSDNDALVAGVDGSTASGDDIAGVLSFYFRGEVLPYYGGSVTRARSIRGCNHFMYWELLRRSVNEGVLGFDFGRSKQETGPFEFKKHFGFQPEALPYEYFLVESDSVPDVNPSNPKYRLLVDTWRRMPLPLANVLGPPLARSLG